MGMIHGGWRAARMLKREGLEVVFTLSGGHIAAIYEGWMREGIRVVDTRHDKAAVDPGEPEQYRAGGRTVPDPALIHKAAALLEKAYRPVIMAGTAVWWCNAAEPLRQLAERVQAPVFLNGAGRGCLPPTHPLFFSAARRKALEGADTILAIGTRMDFRLNHGQPPLIPATANVIWFDLAAEDVGVNRGAAAALVGDVGFAIRQLTGATKQLPAGEWLTYIRGEEH